MNMVFRRSAFKEGRRGGVFSLPGAGCRSLGGRMPRSGGNHADDSSAFDAHGEGKGIFGGDFPGFHAPSVIFFCQIPENGGLVCRVFVQEIQRNGNGAFPAVSVHQSNVPLVS